MKTESRLTMRLAKSLIVRGLIGFGMLLSLTGCFLQSVHPLSTDKDSIFEPSLLGTWVGNLETEKSTIIFRKSNGQAYEVNYYPIRGEPARFEAHLVRLGKWLFLDTYPANAPDITNALCILHFFPAHQVFKIQLDGDLLRVATLDSDKINWRAGEIRHERSERAGSFLITAPTPEFRDFILKHAEDAFTDVGEWHRQKEGDQQ